MKIYIDLTGEGCVGVCLKPGYEPVCTGTEIHREPAKYRGCEAAQKLETESDFHFWYDDETPDVALYTVPKVEVGGYDSRGGLFVGSYDFSFRDAQPMYYISPQRECFLIVRDSREFRDLGQTWREKMTPSDAVACFSCKAQAQEKYEIRTLKDLFDSDF